MKAPGAWCAVLLAVACGGDASGPAAPSATGTWDAAFAVGGTPATFRMHLAEGALGALTGEGAIIVVVGDSTLADSVVVTEGRHLHPTIRFTLLATTAHPATETTFAGAFTTDDSFDVTFDTDRSLTFVRQ